MKKKKKKIQEEKHPVPLKIFYYKNFKEEREKLKKKIKKRINSLKKALEELRGVLEPKSAFWSRAPKEIKQLKRLFDFFPNKEIGLRAINMDYIAIEKGIK